MNTGIPRLSIIVSIIGVLATGCVAISDQKTGAVPTTTIHLPTAIGVSGRRPAAGQITTMCSRPTERHSRSMVGPTFHASKRK